MTCHLTQKLQKLRASIDREPAHGDDGAAMEEDSENLQPLRQMARLTQLRDLLCAHHTIGTSSQSYCFHFLKCCHCYCFALRQPYASWPSAFRCWHKVATTSERPFTVKGCACPWQQATKAPCSSLTIWSWTWSRHCGSAVTTSLLLFLWTVWQDPTTCRQIWKLFLIILANTLTLMLAAGSSWSLWRYRFLFFPP